MHESQPHTWISNREVVKGTPQRLYAKDAKLKSVVDVMRSKRGKNAYNEMDDLGPLGAADCNTPADLWMATKGRGPSKATLDRLARAAIREVFLLDSVTMKELDPHRVMCVWRITRELARVKGLLDQDQSMAEALPPRLVKGKLTDPWSSPLEYEFDTHAVKPIRMQVTTLRGMLGLAANLSDEAQFDLPHRGLALLPPPIPVDMQEFEEPLPTYDPHSDEMLTRFIEMTQYIAGYLHIRRGTNSNPQLGRLGLIGLDNPEYIRECWPTRLSLIYWEENLIQQTLAQLVQGGTNKARKWLKEEHGMQPHETSQLLKLAVVSAREQVEMDVEEQRALMIMRLEDYCRRTQDALDLRAELAGYKQLSIVQGLSKIAPEDEMTMFAQIVGKADRKEIQVRNLKMLEGK